MTKRILYVGRYHHRVCRSENDLKTYGNFGLTDTTGSAYVYGLTAGWGGEGKKAGELGLNFGDKITIIGYHTSYKNAPQVGGAFLFSKGK